MSGSRLCSLLGELGYEGHESLNPDGFEWPFQHEKDLLDWICSSLRPSNALSPSQLSQYKQLVQEGKLLEGELLDSAYDSISAFTVFGGDEGLKDIREATISYKGEAMELQKRLRTLQAQSDMLAGQASFLAHRRKARMAATSDVKGCLSLLDEKLAMRSLEMDGVLGKIASTALELAHYHSEDDGSIYLAYSDFHAYLLGDTDCRKELNQWFEKQLNTGPFQLVAEEGKSKCSWDPEKSHQHRVAELQRLRSIFGTSERQWVEAQVENAKQQAMLSVLKAQLSSDEAHIHLDLYSLRRKHSELVGELSNLYRKEQKLLSETIPGLCWELAQLQDTLILQGDYDLRVMRQEHYMNQQKLFINHLIKQFAGHQFLKIVCQVERKTMLGVYFMLRVIESELQGYLLATNDRVDRSLALKQAAYETHEQGAVDDRDTFLHGVRDLLSIHSNSQGGLPAYVSAPGIIQQISGLHSDLISLRHNLEKSLPQDRNRCISNLCSLIQRLQQLLFASSTTAEPVLTPWPLMKELEELEKMNSELFVAVDEITSEHQKKVEIFKHHQSEVHRERQVFVDFFCNPNRLRNQVRELSDHIKALHF